MKVVLFLVVAICLGLSLADPAPQGNSFQRQKRSMGEKLTGLLNMLMRCEGPRE